MKHKNLHTQVRIIYRACRKQYGIDKTQRECLKIFYAIFPALNELYSSENERAEIPQELIDNVLLVVNNWNPTNHLKKLADTIIGQMQMPFDWDRHELIDFYEDILPVVMKIRKQTTRELFRLMDVDECDIDKILQSNITKNNQRKLAGNSIVVNVLYHILRNLLIDVEDCVVIQLTLF